MRSSVAIVIAILVFASAAVARADAPADKGKPVLSITPKSVHFGKAPVGSSTVEVLTITNSSDASVEIVGFGLSFNDRGDTGNMELEPVPPATPGGTCPEENVLAPGGGSCTVWIAFRPIAAGKVVYDFFPLAVTTDGGLREESIVLAGVGI